MLCAWDWLGTRHSELEGDPGAAKRDPCGLKGGEEGKEEAGNGLPNSNRSATVGK